MLLKTKDLREKTVAELRQELSGLRKDLFKAKMSLNSRQLEDTSSLRNVKKSIAKILTILRQKEEK